MAPTDAELALAYPWALRVARFADDGRFQGRLESTEPPWWPPRSAWGDGPWMSEPDLVEWRLEGAPYPLMILRGDMGALCGYVGVPPTHPHHGKSHRGFSLTWSSPCGGLLVPTGDPPDVWWLGFDCGHSCELAPLMAAGLGVITKLIEASGLNPAVPPGHHSHRKYIEIGECRKRTEALARALLEAASEDVNDG
jgi:hypothetical protein